jgi:hypothetical protein
MAVPCLRPLAVASILALASCNKAPAEPDGQASSSSPSTPIAPLVWDTPSTWTRLDVGGSSARKAAYQVSPAGNDKAEAQADVHFYGTGSAGDPAAIFKEWFGQFDGNVGATAARETTRVRDLDVEYVDVPGTYKLALSAIPRGRKEPAAQRVMKGWRLYGAVVKTKDRGNWFFRVVGPDDTVQAARSAFRQMIESAR